MNIAMLIAHLTEIDAIELDTRAFNRRKKKHNDKAVRILMRTRTDVGLGFVRSAQLSHGRRNSSN